MTNFISHSAEKLAMSPALPLVLTTFAELIEQKLTVPYISFSNESRIIWVEKFGTVVGGIVWEYKPDSGCAWIILSFTHKNYRRQGVNKLCYAILEEQSKKLGATHLSSFVSIHNRDRLDSMESVGMKPAAYKTFKSLQ